MDTTRGSIAGVWVTVLILLFILMLIYMTFYNLIAITLFGLVEYYCGDVEVARNVVTFFKFFPAPFILSLFIWGIMNSFRRETDVYRYR